MGEHLLAGDVEGAVAQETYAIRRQLAAQFTQLRFFLRAECKVLHAVAQLTVQAVEIHPSLHCWEEDGAWHKTWGACF
ncbi:hypothetical protein D9M71_808570 [compost metagenome]